MRKPSDRNGSDVELLRKAYSGVKPLRNAARVATTPTGTAPISRRPFSAVSFQVQEEGGRIEALRIGHDPQELMRLKRAEVPPLSSLDLHGLRSDQARTKTASFVRQQVRRGVRTALIIHGKGSHSEDGRGVLREAVVQELTHGSVASLVVALASAPARLGGTGALVLLLAKR